MNRPIKIRAIAEKLHDANPTLNVCQWESALSIVSEALGTLLASGQAISLPLLGNFYPYQGKPRVGRDIRNPEKVIAIPARRRIKFKPAPHALNITHEQKP